MKNWKPEIAMCLLLQISCNGMIEFLSAIILQLLQQIIYLSDLYLKMNGQKNACLNVIVKYLKIIGHKMYILMWL